ncbi:hypothetical protein STEG23_001032 [Scotinomys teguina]
MAMSKRTKTPNAPEDGEETVSENQYTDSNHYGVPGISVTICYALSGFFGDRENVKLDGLDYKQNNGFIGFLKSFCIEFLFQGYEHLNSNFSHQTRVNFMREHILGTSKHWQLISNHTDNQVPK